MDDTKKIKSSLVSTRNTIKKKFEKLHNDRVNRERKLIDKYKPITNSIKGLAEAKLNSSPRFNYSNTVYVNKNSDAYNIPRSNDNDNDNENFNDNFDENVENSDEFNQPMEYQTANIKRERYSVKPSTKRVRFLNDDNSVRGIEKIKKSKNEKKLGKLFKLRDIKESGLIQFLDRTKKAVQSNDPLVFKRATTERTIEHDDNAFGDKSSTSKQDHAPNESEPIESFIVESKKKRKVKYDEQSTSKNDGEKRIKFSGDSQMKIKKKGISKLERKQDQLSKLHDLREFGLKDFLKKTKKNIIESRSKNKSNVYVAEPSTSQTVGNKRIRLLRDPQLKIKRKKKSKLEMKEDQLFKLHDLRESGLKDFLGKTKTSIPLEFAAEKNKRKRTNQYDGHVDLSSMTVVSPDDYDEFGNYNGPPPKRSKVFMQTKNFKERMKNLKAKRKHKNMSKQKKGGNLERMFIPYTNNIVYEYYDDPNELCERLQLLISSKSVGNSNHDQEINTILEELRERNVIE